MCFHQYSPWRLNIDLLFLLLREFPAPYLNTVANNMNAFHQTSLLLLLRPLSQKKKKGKTTSSELSRDELGQ